MLARQLFNKKNKKLSTWREWLNRLSILIAMVLLAIVVSGIHLLFASKIMAHVEMAQLRFTPLPPDSEFISFEIDDTGNTVRWLYGKLYFVTDASESTVLNFFKMDDFDTCWGSGYSGLMPQGHNDKGQTIYVLCHWSSTKIEN